MKTDMNLLRFSVVAFVLAICIEHNATELGKMRDEHRHLKEKKIVLL